MDWDHRDNIWRIDPACDRVIIAQLCDEPHDHDIAIGMFDTPELAAHIVEVHNQQLAQRLIEETA